MYSQFTKGACDNLLFASPRRSTAARERIYKTPSRKDLFDEQMRAVKRHLDHSRNDTQNGAYLKALGSGLCSYLYEMSGDEAHARKVCLGRIKDPSTFGDTDP